ncbi:claudin-34 [Denticeps clupeoides]|uniref:claudin-34 n=1 Tax=Denticeps clupeoides TaxID=299321 RepID=UPI0010A39C96|nr:claudin-34-like [Denticeps clupeoides]
MAYLAHTGHLQFVALVVGALGWILIVSCAGINDWRLWHVADRTVISSGEAWVGVWRACFDSHALGASQICTAMSVGQPFLPTEIGVAQVLLMAAVVLGIFGNVAAGCAVRKVYFGLDNPASIKRAFPLAGALYLTTAACSLVPVFWNMASVLTNRTIDFPPDFHFPPAPVRQEVGSGIVIGIGASVMVAFSGLAFLSYRYPVRTPGAKEELGNARLRAPPALRAISEGREDKEGTDNPAFEAEENHTGLSESR